MATHIPAKLKTPELNRFIVRAAQLEAAKPVISYWCEYWIANQVLARGLHTEDAEIMEYTMNLMDKLERIKSENPTNDAIIDELAGQAYVEQFGLETFSRADRAVQADKVTKQTADTFQAASTFLELLNIWGQPDAEILAKIKYAKWNAVRIGKAIREGKDPNESNPKTEPEPEELLPELDPNDPEVQEFGGSKQSRQPSVVEVPDEQDQIESKLARQSSIDQSLHPSAQVSARGSPAAKPAGFEPYPRDGFPYTAAAPDNVSPLEASPNERNGSVGGGYFPEVPTFTGETQNSTLPTAPPDDVLDLGLPDPPADYATPGFQPPSVSEVAAPPPILPPHDFYRQGPPPPPSSIPPHPAHIQQLAFQKPPQQYAQPPPAPVPVPAPVPLRNQQLIIDDVAIAKAQKHARWAISALNFEDAETAVRELRAALQTLGAE